MSNLFRNRAGTGFDQLFEPDANGVSIPGFYGADGQLLKFASLANGSKIANVEHYHPDGPDVTNYWAGAGTVAYTYPLGDIGTYDVTANMIQPVNWGNRITSSFDLYMKSDGTYQIWRFGTNWVDDTRSSNSQNIINPGVPGQSVPAGQPAGTPVGVLWSQGKWLQTPGAGKGAAYTMEVSVEASEWGRTDYAFVPPTSWYYNVNLDYGVFNTDAGVVTNVGTHSLASDVIIRGLLDQTPLANNYHDPNIDRNGGLSRYWRGRVRIKIFRNGVLALSFRFLFHTQNRWINSDDAIGTGTGGGGTGGGTGGSDCVSVNSYVYGYKPVVAGELGLGNTLTVTDPYLADANSSYGEIRYVQRSMQPMVRFRTKSGAQLTCSTSAPIATKDAGYVLAPDLKGHFIAVATKEQIDRDNTSFIWDEVVSVEDAGMGWVQKINVDNRAFWAGDDGELFVLHHNLKHNQVETQAN